MGAHFILSPSSSSRWLKCTGSVDYITSLDLPEEKPSYYAAEGTAAHQLAEDCLRAGVRPDASLGEVVEVDGFEITHDQEMIDAVNMYLDRIERLVPIADKDRVFPEVELPLFYTFRGESGTGTSDAVVFDPDTGILHVFDLKYGKGVEVEADGNTQLLIYAVSALDHFEDCFDITAVTAHISQPRIKNYSKSVYTFKELEDFRSKVLMRVKQIEEGATRFSPSEDGCRWCLAKGSCKNLARHNMQLVVEDFDDLDEVTEIAEPMPPESMSPEQIKLVLDNQKMFESWLKSVAEHAKGCLERGEQVEGYKLVAGRSSRSWANEEDAAKALNGKFRMDEIHVKKLVSPAQAEKLIKKLGDKATTRFLNKVGDLILKNEGNPTLVKDSDKRPALTFASEFEDLDALEDDDFLD